MLAPLFVIIKRDWPSVAVTVVGALITGAISVGYIPPDVGGAVGTGIVGVITAIARRMQP
jgi:hypothetical protein